MGIEERIENLEIQSEKLREEVEILKIRNQERFVSVKELAEIMNCSQNNIYVKIRSGEIFATDKLGSARIPMSQFNENNPKEKLVKRKRAKNKMQKDIKENPLKELLFG